MDKIKEQLNWLKVVFAILTATTITLIGWIASNYSTGNTGEIIMATITTVILILAIILLNKIVFRKIDKLGDL